MEAPSRYAVLAGVRVDDPESVVKQLNEAGDNRVIEVLRQSAFEIRIAFASRQKIETFGDDWRYMFMRDIASNTFNPNRLRPREYSLVAYLPAGMPVDFAWLDAYLTSGTYDLLRVRTNVVARDDRALWLPRLVARYFLDAIEEDIGRPSLARSQYDAIAPLVGHIEDVGLNISYFPGGGGTSSDAIVRASQSS